ncbi:CheD [Syntrophobotulus glycolicus DSM 8271]|uniref:Probable chemoreceptor glutamine deamidase CheD n=1 Tax=Syntrophobotulus glycolicus (strain DSM 8271 / FlGlyR) TaxID=645991 RepID=F0SZW7_SYNGF|nr:chemotaxis protein CheD [Syntrophobotulus glycolicus]ADY54978.1 CheD [Syntrophobotulus glycolicus DSM 8271]
MSITIVVGMADYKVGRSPDKIMTAGLGSCIGICLYDSMSKIGGMAHIMLPESKNMKGSPAKYADTCMVLLLEELMKQGALKNRLKAKIAGGAQMFSFAGKDPIMKIGERNAQAVQRLLTEMHIPLLASDVGGTFGRTINFDIQTGNLHIKTINYGEKVI